MSNLTPYLLSQNLAICLLSPGSCLPKSLQGTPRTTSPSLAYLSCSACRPLYWSVRPHSLATLTISTTFPWYFDSSTSLPSRLFILKLSTAGTFLSSAETVIKQDSTSAPAIQATKARILISPCVGPRAENPSQRRIECEVGQRDNT